MARKSNSTLADWLIRKRLSRFVGEPYYARGWEYFRNGAVTSLVQHGERLHGRVRGTRPYAIDIWTEKNKLHYRCSCPAGGFCKHLVAAALAWNDGKAETLEELDELPPLDRDRPPHGAEAPQTAKKLDLRAHLLSRPPNELVDLILELAVDHPALRERLRLSAAVANPDGVDLSALRRRIDAALVLPEYDDDRYSYDEDLYDNDDYARQLDPVLEALEKLLSRGQSASVVQLAQYAIDTLDGNCQDMEYGRGDLEEMAEKLCDLHARALASAPADPGALAEWLFRLSVTDAATELGGLPWRIYLPALGPSGKARFRALASAAWERLPALKTRTDRDANWTLRGRLKDILMQFAESDRDVDAQAAIARKDLSSPQGYYETARIYQQAKRHDNALSWAEKGWNAFPQDRRRDPALRDLFAAELRRHGRRDEALALYWNEFDERPGLDAYQELKKQADRDKAWPAWRERAFARIREGIAARGKKTGKEKPKSIWNRRGYDGDDDYGDERADHTLLVKILLWEKNPEEAWKEAGTGGCTETCWLELASWREKRHPADCIPIWRKRIERLTRDANSHDYTKAAESLVKLGALMARTGEGAAFAAEMKTLRERLKRRTRFIRELDQKKLP